MSDVRAALGELSARDDWDHVIVGTGTVEAVLQ
jgi:hypothetical protein